MNLSQCECPIGSNGAPCKYQYLLWLKHWSTISQNFLPIFNGKEQQEFAKLGVGVSGPDGLYEGIRDRITKVHPVADHSNIEPANTRWDETISHTTHETEMEDAESSQPTDADSCEAESLK